MNSPRNGSSEKVVPIISKATTFGGIIIPSSCLRFCSLDREPGGWLARVNIPPTMKAPEVIGESLLDVARGLA